MLLQLLLLGIFLYALQVGLDHLSAPWAYPSGGRPPLTGGWSGTMTTPDGRRGTFTLTLVHPLPRYHRHSSMGRSFRDVRGTATLDLAAGGAVPSPSRQSYTLWGSVDRNNHTVYLGTKLPAPARSDYCLGSLRGEWNGETLAITGNWRKVELDPKRGNVWFGEDSRHPIVMPLHHANGIARPPG